ncbi:TonB-dependent receptor [Sphingomonas sp. CARO-RG-8B-R24-01]|uniref:TonB-dependent receptor n=1 Tax=Sphingomonas sp. CARO-RG-8B-R24-01 TaxID=2914831 RepID=UPI001F5ADBB9|nr:TonB-dependent receptor [Sphingomonas sp. CARO-RG-8B-R24-01]
MLRSLLLSSVAVSLLMPVAAVAQQTQTIETAVDSTPAPTATASPGTPAGPDIVITGRLDAARASIQPSLGATTYSITNAQIQALPGGDNLQLNQILLQLPGVVQDGGGQFHVRDDHNNLQYRINGTILPEGVSVFGQTLSPRIVERFDLRTGALPAQYGLRTAGIIDVTTKSHFDNSGVASLYGGTNDTIQPSVEYGGSTGQTNYFVTGSYKHSNIGIEAVDPGRTPIHDNTDQYQGFVYLDHTLDSNNRVSLIGGYADQNFQIPNPRGLHPDSGYTVGGQTDFLSNDLDERQHEQTAFALASLLHDAGPLTLQASLFARYSALRYTPDVVGELLFNGLAQNAYKRDFTFGGQVEGAYRLSSAHTLRGGVIVSRDRNNSQTATQVLPGTYDADRAFTQTGQPVTVVDNGAKTEMTYSVYLQDEWKIAEPLVVNFGGRFDHYDGYRSESAFSPRVNAVLTPVEGLALHAGYSRYFSPPPFANVATTSVLKFRGTSAQAPGDDGANTPLADAPYAEKQDYFDIGGQWKLSPTVTVGLDGYYRKSYDLLDEGQFGAPIILTPFNYGRGTIKGAEANVSYAAHGLSLYGNLAYAKAQGTNIVSSQFNFAPADLATIARQSIYLDHDQTWTASAGASYRIEQGGLRNTRIGGSMLYGSGLRRDGDVPNGGKLPAYAVFNLTTSHTFTGPGIEIRADIINVADHVYEIRDGSGVGVGAPQFGARRGFLFGISKTI